jgi:3-deoxy-7-phosphoheptulonate synthase
MSQPTQIPVTDDLRITAVKQLMRPEELLSEIPTTGPVAEVVAAGREGIQKVLRHEDDRLVVVVGPCSIHDPEAAIEYAKQLAQLKEKHQENLLIVMRVYFEKPRTTVGLERPDQ